MAIPFELKEATLVDVRVPEEFAESPVKNAVNIPLSQIENNLDFFRKQSRTVMYCNTGKQTAEAMEILKKNGIRNVYSVKSWKNAFAMQNNIYGNLNINTEKPSTHIIKKTDKILIVAVGLGEGTVLKKHTTADPATFTVLKGELLFKIDHKEFLFVEGDVYEIPVNMEHEVVGKAKENVFTLTKELQSKK